MIALTNLQLRLVEPFSMTKMSQLTEKLSQLDEITDKLSQLKIKFDRKDWVKKYQKRRVTCQICGKDSFLYKLKRHQRSLKCLKARMAKIKL